MKQSIIEGKKRNCDASECGLQVLDNNAGWWNYEWYQIGIDNLSWRDSDENQWQWSMELWDLISFIIEWFDSSLDSSWWFLMDNKR